MEGKKLFNVLFSSCAAFPFYRDRRKVHHSMNPLAVYPWVQIHPLLHPSHPTAMKPKTERETHPGRQTRAPLPLPLTAVWAAVTTVCGSNTPNSCSSTTTTEETERWPPLRKMFSMKTSKHIWSWRSDCWIRRDKGPLPIHSNAQWGGPCLANVSRVWLYQLPFCTRHVITEVSLDQRNYLLL